MKRWDIVLLAFPFTDRDTLKVRPALVVSPNPDDVSEDDAVFMAFTTNCDRMATHDMLLSPDHPEFPRTGLRRESVLRVNKIWTLKKGLVMRTLGSLGTILQADVKARMRAFWQL